MTNIPIKYSALVFNLGEAHQYDVEFERTPTLMHVLTKLQSKVLTAHSRFDPAISSAVHAAFFGGQADEAFNESGVFQHRINDDAWLRVHCPLRCCDSQVQTEYWL